MLLAVAMGFVTGEDDDFECGDLELGVWEGEGEAATPLKCLPLL